MNESITYFENGVKITRLPTIGEPISIKTCKQGRMGTIKDQMIDPLLLAKDQKFGGIKKRASRRKRSYLFSQVSKG